MKNMAMRIMDFFICNMRQVLETIVLLVGVLLPWIINIQDVFKEYLEENPISPDNFWWYVALTYGKLVASVILFVVLIIFIRNTNKGYTMNEKYTAYHDYSYFWYYFSARILGIRKCNLINVPIYTQYKLVLRATFQEYPLQDEDFPTVEDERDCRVTISNEEKDMHVINLLIEDTYPIEESQISKKEREKYTIIVSRYNGSSNRCFSPKLVEATKKVLSVYKRIHIVNVYSTTNPKNTLFIAKQVFGAVNRGNVKHLYVFQQKKEGRRSFELKGHKIF